MHNLLGELQDFNKGMKLMSLCSAVSAKPALKAEEVQIVVESSLRLLLLAEHVGCRVHAYLGAPI
jgi:hypothetical protein